MIAKSHKRLIIGRPQDNPGLPFSGLVAYDQPTYEYLFDSGRATGLGADSNTTIYERMGSGYDLHVPQDATDTVVWTSGSTGGLYINAPPDLNATSVDTGNNRIVHSSSTPYAQTVGTIRQCRYSSTGTYPTNINPTTDYWNRYELTNAVGVYPSLTDAQNQTNKITGLSTYTGTLTIIYKNGSNYWKSKASQFMHDWPEGTIYLFGTVENALDITDVLAVTQNSYTTNRFKFEVGHSKHYTIRVGKDIADFYKVKDPNSFLVPYPSGANQGTEYPDKFPLTYRNNGTKTNTALANGSDYLFVFSWKTYGPNRSSILKMGFSKVGDAAGFDYENDGIANWYDKPNKRYYRQFFSGGGRIDTVANSYLQSNVSSSVVGFVKATGENKEQGDFRYKKMIIYNTFKDQYHDEAVRLDGVNKNAWLLGA